MVSGAPRMVSGGAILILKGAFGLGPKGGDKTTRDLVGKSIRHFTRTFQGVA